MHMRCAKGGRSVTRHEGYVAPWLKRHLENTPKHREIIGGERAVRQAT